MVSPGPDPVASGEPRLHESRCSFCLGPRETGRDLIAAERASICVPCVRLHRRRPWWDPRGWPPRLRSRLRARRIEAAPLPPYRDALGTVCSFCKQEEPVAVRGAAAQICVRCLALAVGILVERRL